MPRGIRNTTGSGNGMTGSTTTQTRRKVSGGKRAARGAQRTGMPRGRQSGLGNVTFTAQQVAYLLQHGITAGRIR